MCRAVLPDYSTQGALLQLPGSWDRLLHLYEVTDIDTHRARCIGYQVYGNEFVGGSGGVHGALRSEPQAETSAHRQTHTRQVTFYSLTRSNQGLIYMTSSHTWIKQVWPPGEKHYVPFLVGARFYKTHKMTH